jgi:lysophospholipase L1-like esterase
MKKFLPIIIIVIVGVYLNRSYAYIYDKISMGDLKLPEQNQIYLVSENDNSDKILTYVALGDSLTVGVGTDNYEQSYPYLLAQKLAGSDNKVILKNRAFLGLKTEGVDNTLLIPTILDKPNIVTLLIGVNDIHNNISKKDFRINYEQILRRLTQETSAEVYVINIPYLGSDKLILPPYDYFFDYQTKQFNKIIKELADDYNANYIDLYTSTTAEFKKSGAHYSRDLFHPSAEGYSLWAKIIYDNINK